MVCRCRLQKTRPDRDRKCTTDYSYYAKVGSNALPHRLKLSTYYGAPIYTQHFLILLQADRIRVRILPLIFLTA